MCRGGDPSMMSGTHVLRRPRLPPVQTRRYASRGAEPRLRMSVSPYPQTAVMANMGPYLQQRAAALAEELASGVREARAVEWLEEAVLSALADAMDRERERCALLAEQRAALWETSDQKFRSPEWPACALSEARACRNEALALADAIRAGASPQTGDAAGAIVSVTRALHPAAAPCTLLHAGHERVVLRES